MLAQLRGQLLPAGPDIMGNLDVRRPAMAFLGSQHLPVAGRTLIQFEGPDHGGDERSVPAWSTRTAD